MKRNTVRKKTAMAVLALATVLAGVGPSSLALGAADGWHIQVVDGQDGNAGDYTSIAVDQAGYPHISYCAHNDLRYAWHDGTAWHIDTVDSEGCLYTSLTLDSLGEPHISYFSGGSGNLMYAHYYTGDWHISTVDSEGWVGEYSSIAVDSQRLPHIAYWDRTNSALKVARRIGATWQFDTVDPDVWITERTSLALDSLGRARVAYYHHNAGILRYAYYDGATWHVEPLTDGHAGACPSLAIDDYDHPHISYQGDGLMYAYHDGSQWHHTTVQHGMSAGRPSSLALDDAGRPHIAYSDWPVPEHTLRYARFDGRDWQIETVDTTSASPDPSQRFEEISLALGPNRQPHISYYVYGAWDLRYATKAPRPQHKVFLPLVVRLDQS